LYLIDDDPIAIYGIKKSMKEISGAFLWNTNKLSYQIMDKDQKTGLITMVGGGHMRYQPLFLLGP